MNIKAVVYLPVVALVLLFGLVPLQNIHAMDMSHDMGNMRKSTTNCCTSPSPSVILDQQQKTPDRDVEEDLKPQQVPYYAQFQRLDVQNKPFKINTYGASLLRPPDLVVLYMNFRI